MRHKHASSYKSSTQRLGKVLMAFSLGLASILPGEMWAQQVTVHIKQGNLDQAFQQIMKGNNIQLVYNTDVASNIKCKACSFRNREVNDVITFLLKGTNLTYTYHNGIYTIQVKQPTLRSQEGFIAGQILDESREAVIGATVVVKETRQGLATDMNGRFRLEHIHSNNGKVTLQISYIGKKSIEQKVKLNSTNTFILEENTHLMSEVVVTGYQHISRERSTAAYGFINSENLNRQMHSDLSSSLEGKIAGLQMNINPNTGDMTPVLRGVGTFSSEVGTSPLIVIDDMPTNMTLNDINPYNVESITVLKDAAAASIYGALAANGVIVVTTKQASQEKTAVNINADWFITTKPRFDNLHLASTSDIIDYQTAVFNDNVAEAGSIENFLSSYRSGYYNPLFQLYQDQSTGKLSQEEVNATLSQWRNNDYYKEFRDNAWRTSLRQRYNINISQKRGKSNHYTSFSYEKEKGRIISESNDRFSLYYKSNYALTHWLTLNLGIDANLSHGNTANGAYTSYTLQQRYERILDADGNRYISPYVNVSGYTGSAYNGSVVSMYENTEPYKSFGFNVLDALYEGMTETQDLSIRPFFSLQAKFLKMFTYNLMYQYEWNYGQSELFDSVDSYQMRMTYNSMIDTDGVSHMPDGGRLYRSELGSRRYILRNQINFDKTWKDHTVTAIAGLEFRENKIPKPILQLLYGYDPQTLTSDIMNWQDFEDGVGTSALSGSTIKLNGLPNTLQETRHRYASFYSNANYSYKSKYNISGSLRWDQADLFGLDIRNQRHPLWSVGGSWTLSEESFLKNIDWLNYLKLRVTYGINGNVDQSSTTYFVVKQKVQSNPIKTNYLTYEDDDLPNPQLRWEKTATYNMGLDFRFLNDKIRGSIEYYNRSASDLLVRRYMDPTIGADSRVVNNGKMRNRGVELSLMLDIVRKKDWNMGVDFNFSYNKNKMTKVDHDATASSTNFILSPQNYFIEGTSYNTLWAYRIDRIENGYPIAVDKDGNDLITFNEDGTVKDIKTTMQGTENLVNMGTLTPKYNGSFTWRIGYKNIDFNAFFVFAGGHKMRNCVISMNDMAGSQTIEEIATRWDADNPNANVRMYMDMPTENRTYASTLDNWWKYGNLNVKGADYFKLRSLSIGYTMPTFICKKMQLNSLRFKFQVDNLFTWCKAGKGIDPESYSLNSGTRGMAIPRTYSIGISTSF